MSKKKPARLKARLPRGFADRDAADIRAVEAMMAKIRGVYERYGFTPVETPFVEYTDALGKFLPDQDRPNEGVFSLKDDDGQWLSLRYDLTAPLARFVAENYHDLPLPYRSYRAGWVFRNEKPGPGRFRQFMQSDADIVGSASPAADAEMAMMMADVMEAVGIRRGDYVIRVNNRKVLDGVMEANGIADEHQKVAVLRAIDKKDRLGIDGVRLLLGKGRKDESGDFSKGAELEKEPIETILRVIFPNIGSISDDINGARQESYLDRLMELIGGNEIGLKGIEELTEIVGYVLSSGYGGEPVRVAIDPSVVRGLEYYTGPVFEADLTFETVNEKGEKAIFGSVGGGGRYDGLVGRFRGENVPATGFSIGVSRLAAALRNLGRLEDSAASGPVVVTVMDKGRIADYQRLAAQLREGLNAAGGAPVPVELYLGNPKNFGKQLQYADRRNAPCVVIQGSDEAARDVVQVKDMAEGRRRAEATTSHQEWREERPGQFEVSVDDMVAAVRRLLQRQGRG